MPRHLNLRQIEAFKALMVQGTVSRGAEALNISQPAMSKLILHLEADTGLRLFDRVKGRLVPTEQAMRLNDEVERIFAGVRQVESAVDAIRREEQSRLAIGAMPALAGSFIQRATMKFLATRKDVLCTITPLSSQWTVELLLNRSIDVGLVSAPVDNPYLVLEPLMEHPLVCIMPLKHPLSELSHVEPHDLADLPFVNFNADGLAGRKVSATLDAYGVRTRSVLIAGAANTICEFVAAGLGVSLVHPLMASGLEDRLTVRPFLPEIPYKFQIGRSDDNRNARLVEAYAQELRETAAIISQGITQAG